MHGPESRIQGRARLGRLPHADLPVAVLDSKDPLFFFGERSEVIPVGEHLVNLDVIVALRTRREGGREGGRQGGDEWRVVLVR